MNDTVCDCDMSMIIKDSQKLTVVKKVGPSSYLLSDDRKCNASKLLSTTVRTVMRQDETHVLDGFTVPENLPYNAHKRPRETENHLNGGHFL